MGQKILVTPINSANVSLCDDTKLEATTGLAVARNLFACYRRDKDVDITFIQESKHSLSTRLISWRYSRRSIHKLEIFCKK